MTVIKKFVSILLAASLCIGSIFSVQGDNAFSADAAARPAISSSYIQGLLDQFSSDPDYETASLALRSYFNDPDVMIVFTYVNDSNFNITFWADSLGSFRKVYVFDNRMICYQGYFRSSYVSVIDGNIVTTLSRTNNDRIIYEPVSLMLGSAIPVCGNYIESSSISQYFNYDLYSWSTDQVIYTPNLYEEWGPPDPPVPEPFDLIRFQLGTRTYLTTSDQSMIRSLDPDQDDYSLIFGFMLNEQDTLDIVYYKDLVLLNNAQYMISDTLTNLSPLGVYAYDITDCKYDSIFYAKIVGDWYGEIVPFYEADNLPLDFPSGPGDVDDPYDDAWSQFIDYNLTYNTTHVVPQNLGDTLFGLTGSQTAACWVSLPDDLVVTGTTSPLLDTIQRGFNDLDPSIDFTLMDVLVFPAGAAESLVEYYYNKSFTPSMAAIDRFSFSNLLSLYDVIIIVDSEYTVGSLNPFVVSETGGILHRAFTGLSQGGMDYVDAAISPWPEDQTYHGFCFITKKAIQKQQLFNFNDGITKTYDLMVQYIDKRDAWDDSFLLWSSGVFNMINSVDGHLDKIQWFLSGDIKLSDFLNNIIDKLDTLVNNTSVDEVTGDSWFPSLWRFINRFSIQDSTFANWLDDLDDFYDDLPDLPELQPTIIPFPTYIPEPTAGAG